MITSSYSQSKLVIRGDTVIAMSEKQLRNANKKFIDLKVYKNFSDSLVSEGKRKELTIRILKENNSAKTSEIYLLTTNYTLCDSINKIREERIILLNQSLKLEQKKKVRNLFIGTAVGAIIATITIALLNIFK